MIPKIIHYCWFGRGPLPELTLKCIESWKKYLPEYEIKLWNEDNFDVSRFQYAAEAYEAKKYAFVADVCRLFTLKEIGGVYLDTDVEFIKPLPDEFLNDTAFTGFEDDLISAGIIGSVKHGEWITSLFSFYENRSFYLSDGSFDMNPITEMITEFSVKTKGMQATNVYQKVENYCTVYPSEYFYPKSWKTGKLNITPNTYSIHHFAGSWVDQNYTTLGKIANTLLGAKTAQSWSKVYRKFKGRQLRLAQLAIFMMCNALIF